MGDASKINRPGAEPHKDCELLPARTVEVPVNHNGRADPQSRSQPALYSTSLGAAGRMASRRSRPGHLVRIASSTAIGMGSGSAWPGWFRLARRPLDHAGFARNLNRQAMRKARRSFGAALRQRGTQPTGDLRHRARADQQQHPRGDRLFPRARVPGIENPDHFGQHQL